MLLFVCFTNCSSIYCGYLAIASVCWWRDWDVWTRNWYLRCLVDWRCLCLFAVWWVCCMFCYLLFVTVYFVDGWSCGLVVVYGTIILCLQCLFGWVVFDVLLFCFGFRLNCLLLTVYCLFVVVLVICFMLVCLFRLVLCILLDFVIWCTGLIVFSCLIIEICLVVYRCLVVALDYCDAFNSCCVMIWLL